MDRPGPFHRVTRHIITPDGVVHPPELENGTWRYRVRGGGSTSSSRFALKTPWP